ncbi:hypothetical protein NEUTE1DRAFT_72262 [Neurospora tetrasperma FGSC 2508]|uniref:Zinc finger C2H2 LYAR-type domain-containing protein n=1 Tax=Neurospora tetrasperma (strain FGSC 2508 / ATCC MYA-4615 / P0657) TaxID=510951 RepID=F8N329_NEUT8|nr:uncharacterized protein NEUTE1DRAFT_72262 [Neurospora tetrasperma FGSC 2508]EGO52540.1 hypothetical protein NEUTE1DRAFT_72262 [Neurospora tetrasperma FGSC 2508]
MVSFSCEVCGDVLTKKKLDPHRQRCWGANFTCIDCMTHFPGTEYRSHTSCMTEEQKYQGALYRPKKGKGAQNQNQNPNQNRNQNNVQAMAQPAYVEEVAEDFDTWRQYDNNGNAPAQAPTPPSATEAPVNVFDYMVNPTPTTSRVSVAEEQPEQKESNEMVRYESKTKETTENAVVHHETPAPKKKSKGGEKEVKKDKKRKRELHIETDHPMTDAPPVLHSGLTGGISRMMSRPDVFPPSPESAETPASPLKKSKHAKHHKSESLGNSLMAMIAGSKLKKSKSSKTKESKDTKEGKEKKSSSASPSSKKHKHSHSKSLEVPKEQKMIEYTPGSKDGAVEKDKDNQVVIFQPRAERFLSFVNKGPESDKGVSLNKALKRYHRERSASGTSVSKLAEEKELWRSLRMRRNDRGEIVLFCV